MLVFALTQLVRGDPVGLGKLLVRNLQALRRRKATVSDEATIPFGASDEKLFELYPAAVRYE